VTPEQQQSISNKMQRMAADISARLAHIAKEPPDLAAYLRLHAEVVLQTLQPVGLAYEMATGQNFQRTFSHNHETLKLRESPAQEMAFQRAVRTTAEQGKPVFLDTQTGPVDGLQGLKVEDAPAPENLPPHNYTPFQQVFVPIPLSKKVVGVLHAWFAPTDSTNARARTAILGHAAAEVELYLKARRISDISQELSRINTYARFLEDVAGDQDLESVAWKLVNYAREAVGCDRVCLMIDRRYGLAASQGLPELKRLALQACSGLRRPHPRSEHAEVLKAHASELLKIAVGTATQAPPATGGPATPPNSETNSTAPSENIPKEDGPNAQAPASASTVDGRPQMRIALTHRDPTKTASRPDAVNRYFEVIPMNWSTVLPLYDRSNAVCGTLLFEGQQTNEKMAALFMQMRDLAVSGGRALSTSLVWHRRRTLRAARVLMRWRDALLGTSRRRLVLKYGLPGMLVVALLAFPFPYRVRGDATLRPVAIQSVAALTTGRLMEVNAREGDRVTAGQVLCVLDSSDLELQMRHAEQEYERNLTEASLALHQDRSETRMQIARLNADKALTLVEKLRRDIELTVIRAPFDGLLIGPHDLTQRKGQIIRSGDTVAEVVDPRHWEVKASVREQDVPTLVTELERLQTRNREAGIPGELRLTANPNQIYPLTLTDPSGFAHRLDTTHGKYNFSAIVPMTDVTAEVGSSQVLELKAGYSGRIRFTCGRRALARILFGDFIRFLKINFF